MMKRIMIVIASIVFLLISALQVYAEIVYQEDFETGTLPFSFEGKKVDGKECSVGALVDEGGARGRVWRDIFLVESDEGGICDNSCFGFYHSQDWSYSNTIYVRFYVRYGDSENSYTWNNTAYRTHELKFPDIDSTSPPNRLIGKHRPAGDDVGRFSVYTPDGTTHRHDAQGTDPFVSNRWYCVEFMVQDNGVSGDVVKIWIDSDDENNPDYDHTSEGNLIDMSTWVPGCSWHWQYRNHAVIDEEHFYYDDIAISTTFIGSGTNNCQDGQITSECTCGDKNYSVGYCCNDIYFDPYYSEITGGCPSGDFYYVDQNHAAASDSNPGTASEPWETIQQGVAQVTAGDTLIVKEGTYTVVPEGSRYIPALNPANSGTAEHPIIIKSDGVVGLTTQHSASGIAQGGNGNSIILDESSSSQTDFYNGWYVRITSGTGQGEYARIASYNPLSKEAVLSHYNWNNVPDTTSGYVLTRPGPLAGTYNRDNIVWDGLKVIEKDNYHPDTGSVVFFSSDNVYFINGEVDAQPVELFDNHNAIRIEGSTNVYVRNNKMHGLEQFPGIDENNPQNHAAIMIYNSNFLILEHNEVYDSYTGFFPKGGNGDHIIRYNYFHDCEKCLRISYHDNVDIYQNIFENCGIMAFQPAEEITNIDFFNNVIYNSTTGINNFFTIGGINVWNNIFAYTGSPYNLDGDPPGNFYSDYNDFYNYDYFRISYENIGGLSAWQSETGYDLNSIEVNPGFVDAANGNFTLQSDSLLMNAGMDRQDNDGDGNTEESIPLGAYITGDECIGLLSDCGGSVSELTCNHPAEQGTPDCTISLNELTSYLNSWKTNLDISINSIMEAINYWKQGSY